MMKKTKEIYQGHTMKKYTKYNSMFFPEKSVKKLTKSVKSSLL